MQGVGTVLHRQKVRAPSWVLALTAWMPPAMMAATTLALHGPQAVPLIGGLIYGVVMTGLTLALAGGRIAVSEGELHVQIGPFGPRIRIDEIADCEVGPSGIRSYGLGAQKLLDGTTIYKMLGDNAKAARVTTTDGRKLVIVCPDAEGLVSAVNEAMRRRVPKARVEAAPDDADSNEEEGAKGQRASAR